MSRDPRWRPNESQNTMVLRPGRPLCPYGGGDVLSSLSRSNIPLTFQPNRSSFISHLPRALTCTAGRRHVRGRHPCMEPLPVFQPCRPTDSRATSLSPDASSTVHSPRTGRAHRRSPMSVHRSALYCELRTRSPDDADKLCAPYMHASTTTGSKLAPI